MTETKERWDLPCCVVTVTDQKPLGITDIVVLTGEVAVRRVVLQADWE